MASGGAVFRRPSPWLCPSCGIEVAEVQQYCSVCLRSRPMPTQGAPQVFSGLHIHFNGIIPRTLKHPSHSVEWRMAERHGAICETVFDPSTTNVLVYRPGYERSDKVRLCLTRYTTIPCVPINWILDSLLQSRQIHPVLYRLQSVPAVALPTVRGPSLPHHQHPYYVLNAEEFAIGPLPGKETTTADADGARARAEMGKGGTILMDTGVIPDPIWTSCTVWEAAAAVNHQAATTQDHADDDAAEDTNAKRSGAAAGGLELFVNLMHRNRLDKTLLDGMVVVLSESLSKRREISDVIVALGGVVAPPSAIDTEATHVIYHNDDKKEDLMIDANYAATTSRKGDLVLATINWLEDCLILDELIPPMDVYGPSVKLRATLQKKYEKRTTSAS